MRSPLLRYLAPLAIVALCAAAPAPPSAAASNDIGGLDLPVPAITGAWSVSLRGPGMGGTHAYALDSLGTAIEARIAFYPLDQRIVDPVRLSQAAVASIEGAVSAARATAWLREPNYEYPAVVVAPIGEGRLDPLIPNPTTEAPFPTFRGFYTLTLAWRAPDGTIHHGQAAWNVAAPTAEPADALALAHTIGNAFGVLI
jgi:hypothetical protein